MNSDEIRYDFIKYFENMHDGFVFPKKYFGCLMALLIEEKPITQDRIKQLTDYSKTTISQMLKLIQVSFPLRLIKKSGKRKRFYTINQSVRDFMITFLNMILETYKDRVDFTLPLIEEMRPFSKEHPKFLDFIRFLEQYHEMSVIYLSLFLETEIEFANMIKTNQENASEKHDLSEEELKIVQDILKPPGIHSDGPHLPDMDKNLTVIYTRFKNQYYQVIRENLTSGSPQLNLARTIIGTELLLERRPLTQEEIEKATGFQRSVISETLKKLLEMKMIQVYKKPGDRKKKYVMIQSWDTRMIGRLRVNRKYAIEMKRKVNSLADRIRSKEVRENNNFLFDFLQHIYHSYEQFDKYFELLERNFLSIRIKEYRKVIQAKK